MRNAEKVLAAVSARLARNFVGWLAKLWQIQREVRVLAEAWGGSEQDVCSVVTELDQN
jgi:hypothetical protein